MERTSYYHFADAIPGFGSVHRDLFRGATLLADSTNVESAMRHPPEVSHHLKAWEF